MDILGQAVPGETARVIPLGHLKPVAEGSTRLIYQHPDDADLLIKVLRPEVQKRYRSGSWVKRLGQDRLVKLSLREIREQLVLAAQGEAPAWFMQEIRGFVQTDMGPGLVVEVLRGADGKLALSVLALIEAGKFDAEARSNLKRFVEALLESPVALCAVGLANVVYAADGVHARRFVLVDGFGNRGFLPLKRLSRAVNRRAKVKQLKWFTDEVERRLSKQKLATGTRPGT